MKDESLGVDPGVGVVCDGDLENIFLVSSQMLMIV